MKARLPKGMGGGQQNMNAMIKQAQQMQENIQVLQDELDVREFEATSGGGAVRAVVTGKKEVVSLEIKPDVVDADDIEMLQDLIMSAVNEAIRNANQVTNDEMEKLTGGINLPFN